MQLKNRKVYGIQADGLISDLYINFGESRYAYISLKSFIENIKTWKFNPTDNSSTGWKSILECVRNNELPRSFYFDKKSLRLLDLIAKNRLLKVENNLVHFDNGIYNYEDNNFNNKEGK